MGPSRTWGGRWASHVSRREAAAAGNQVARSHRVLPALFSPRVLDGLVLGHHRSRWPPAIAFVWPTSGEALWHPASGLSKPFFAEPPAAFARQTGAERGRHIVPVPDAAGRHGPKGLAVPDGIGRPGVPAAPRPGAAAGRAP